MCVTLSAVLYACGGNGNLDVQFIGVIAQQGDTAVVVGLMSPGGKISVDNALSDGQCGMSGLYYSEEDYVLENDVPAPVVNGMCFVNFYHSAASVSIQNLYSVNSSGKMTPVIMSLSDCGYMSDGLIPTVRLGGHIVYRDKSGAPKFRLDTVIGQPVVRAASHFSEGVSWFKLKGGRVGLVGSNGKIVMMPRYKTTKRIPVNARHGVAVIPSGKNDNYVVDLSGKELFCIPDAEDIAFIGDTIMACTLHAKMSSSVRTVDVAFYDLKGEKLNSETLTYEDWKAKYIDSRVLYNRIAALSNDMEERAMASESIRFKGKEIHFNSSMDYKTIFRQLNCPFDFAPFEKALVADSLTKTVHPNYSYNYMVVCNPTKRTVVPDSVSQPPYFAVADVVISRGDTIDCTLDYLMHKVRSSLPFKPFEEISDFESSCGYPMKNIEYGVRFYAGSDSALCLREGGNSYMLQRAAADGIELKDAGSRPWGVPNIPSNVRFERENNIPRFAEPKLSAEEMDALDTSFHRVMVDGIPFEPKSNDGSRQLLLRNGNIIKAPHGGLLRMAINGFCSERTSSSTPPTKCCLYRIDDEGNLTLAMDGLVEAGFFNDGVIPTTSPGEGFVVRDRDLKSLFTIDYIDGKRVRYMSPMFVNGVAAVWDYDRKIAIIDTTGKVVVPWCDRGYGDTPRYGSKDHFLVFYKSTHNFSDKGYWILYDMQGNVLHTYRFQDIALGVHLSGETARFALPKGRPNYWAPYYAEYCEYDFDGNFIGRRGPFHPSEQYGAKLPFEQQLESEFGGMSAWLDVDVFVDMKYNPGKYGMTDKVPNDLIWYDEQMLAGFVGYEPI